MTALLRILRLFRDTPPNMQRIAGTSRGFEITGSRETPPVPAVPTITEILEGRQWRAA